MNKFFHVASIVLSTAAISHAALITDPNDARSWQGATVGTFAALIHGSDTLANRQLIVDAGLLDDSIFNTAGFSAASLMPNTYVGTVGTSLDTTGTGGYDYTTDGSGIHSYGDSIDNKWVQTGGSKGDTVWDLGALSSYAAIFPVIDHGPLPQEAIEATVWLTNTPNDINSWVQASFVRVWLEGFQANLGIQWDGFSYVVTTPNHDLFRYASVQWGGPGALFADGDDEINGVLGLRAVPEPGTMLAVSAGLAAFALKRRRRA